MGRRLSCIAASAVMLAMIAGCGSSGQSKPSYCSSLTNLKQSVKALPTTDVIKNGTSALKTNVDKVVSNAQAVVDAAKKDFPNETTAITTAVDSLKTTVNQLQQNASPAVVVQAAGNVASVGSAVKSFSSSASSKCG
jgi:signal transduction protein with GAF and PtsI domain